MDREGAAQRAKTGSIISAFIDQSSVPEPSTLENPPVQHQQIHSIGRQRDQRLLRRVYDRLFVDVEAGVDERGNAAAGMPSFQNAAIERSRLGIDDLRPRRSVDVDYSRNAVAPRRPNVAGYGHETRGVRIADADVEQLFGIFGQYDRRERHEIRPREPSVQGIVDFAPRRSGA